MRTFSLSGKYSLKITLIYLGISCIWIIFSDKFLAALIQEEDLLVQFQTYKGLFFVIVTALLLYYLIRQTTSTLLKSREQLEDALDEKQTLLSELHHRVKNNLAIIAGLVELQSQELTGDNRQALKTTQYRIHTLADIQELLFREENLTNIPFHEHLHELVKSHTATNTLDPVELSIDELIININQAIPLGLLINEVLSQIRLSKSTVQDRLFQLVCTNEEEVSIKICFRDINPEILEKLTNKNKHLEATLIKIYTRQLKGTTEWTHDQQDGNVNCIIKFKISERTGSYSAMNSLANYG
ncbi:sensor histidine kinase [Aliifodinibius sp. S!AR15-10]|uniref:sensor histidine kinase n=1 Tax=Aliifodinibius sp. S!AR15-10 TaxID=2950437 RepID=UPI00285DC744|nr:sensor histidine kinase [Aliifodinibius sp. S!AR15-10]MDR8392392.1 sensor histidine kinase [Aliifodinibius sp. S!AR15-10]